MLKIEPDPQGTLLRQGFFALPFGEQKILQYHTTHSLYGADRTSKALAGMTSLNPTYLSRLFSKETGISIKQFVKEAKVDTAQNLLRYSDLSYLEISVSLGFSSQSAFIAVFKQITGVTPKVYRERYYLTKNI